jgi:hypothetical protein
LEIRDDAATMAIIIGRGAWIAIHHPKPQGIVEKDGNLTSGSRDSFLLADPPRQTPVKRAERSVASPDRGCSQSQQCNARSFCPI